MRREILNLSRMLEAQRVRNMAWWYQSDDYDEELRASEPVLQAYEAARREMSPELCELLDCFEEEMFLLKEAELEATYLQGMSDGLDFLEKDASYRRVS